MMKMTRMYLRDTWTQSVMSRDDVDLDTCVEMSRSDNDSRSEKSGSGISRAGGSSLSGCDGGDDDRL